MPDATIFHDPACEASRDALAEKGPPHGELGLDALGAHPLLPDRPIVETPLGTRPCRPVAAVPEIPLLR